MSNSHTNEPSDELDGAKVLKWAWSGDKPFGFLPITAGEPTDPIEIYGIAICQYEDSANVYRFSCNEHWEVQQDGVYESIEDAIQQLPAQYKLTAVKWVIKSIQ